MKLPTCLFNCAEALIQCSELKWLLILTRSEQSGKSSLGKFLAARKGFQLQVISLHSGTNTSDLLGGFEQGNTERKLITIIKGICRLIESNLEKSYIVTLCQQELQGLLHGRICPSLTRQESLLPLIIEELAMSAITHGSNSARFTEAIGRTTAQPVAVIADSPEWPEITALVRIEVRISFSAHLQAQLYPPDILHIVKMLVGTGLSSQRLAIYLIVINTLTVSARPRAPTTRARPSTLSSSASASPPSRPCLAYIPTTSPSVTLKTTLASAKLSPPSLSRQSSSC
ncbi:hypothetical protein PCANC_02319 [Puccinia coronata f. sp. avenae]|uniref:Uncharacterized protein n=1 Tax=Puccinia coronata f. sp. avenae TaxID=200324 RepID=A0A2N5VZC7_9BASI|nr:hypothetical protein PCANC_02319 [Puccinia coronata f. sp. avenae]